MIEVIDNLLQAFVALTGSFFSGILYLKSRNQAYFLLCGFYGCLMLACLYWTLYIILVSDSPSVFYVSELGWFAGYIFLYMLQYLISDRKEKEFYCPVMWISPLAGVPLLVYFVTIGDILYNILTFTVTMLLSARALRGVVWCRMQTGEKRNRQYFHMAVIGFVVTEYGLWISSYPWAGDTLGNPYFWFDFFLTIQILLFLPAVRKAVDS